MTPRGSNVITFITFVIVALVFGMGGYYVGEHKDSLPRIVITSGNITPTSTQTRVGGVQATPTPTPPSSLTPAMDPKTVVDTFMKNFMDSAPPNNVNGTPAQTARDQLSADAQKTLTQQSPNSIAAGIAKLAGVQNVPSDYKVNGNPTITDNTAIVSTTWDYLSGPLTKVFYLTLQNNQWKIDSIKAQ